MSEYQERITFQDTLTVKFEGENAIDVMQLMGYLSGLNTAYQACLDAEYHSPTMQLQVVAVNQGSFEIHLQSLVALAPDLITILPQAITTFKTLMDIVKLKRDLKGQKPTSVEQEGDRSKIVNHEGDVVYHGCTVTNIYMNCPSVDAGLTEAFSALQSINPRQAVQLTSGTASIKVENEGYSDMAAHIISKADDATIQTSTIETKLRVRKLDFIGDTMWSFIDENGKNITAKIEDEKFSASVKAGMVELSANAILLVRLRIEASLDKFMNMGRKQYYIEKVLSYNPPRNFEQVKMKLEEPT